MIEIQLYRQRLGSFSGGKHHSKRYFLKHAINRYCRHGDKYLVHYFLRMTVFVSLFVVLTAELHLQHLNAKITSSSKLSVNVELNPGPYQINQGNVTLFGETASRQCACNALFSICWSVVRDISSWN